MQQEDNRKAEREVLITIKYLAQLFYIILQED